LTDEHVFTRHKARQEAIVSNRVRLG